MREMTKIQGKYYKWALRFTLKNHNFPTKSEIADHFGVAINNTQLHMTALERKGWIKRIPDSPKYKFTKVKLRVESGPTGDIK